MTKRYGTTFVGRGVCKIGFWLCMLGGQFSTADVAAAPPNEAAVTERGPHHRTWDNVREIQTSHGVTLKTNSYVEMQTALHRWTEQGWRETDPRIEIFQDGAVVRNLQDQVMFLPNLAEGGSLDILLPDGQRLRGHLLGLAYREGNQVVFISEVKECAGEIGGAEQNELIFRDAFTDFHIDVQYVTHRGKLSQSIIIRDRLPHPSEVGLTDAAHVELMTEWVDFPAPTREQHVWEPAQGGQRALIDERIDFGPMRFIPGKAYTVGQQTSTSTRVAKSWEELVDETGNHRMFLLEKIPWTIMEAELEKLPPLQAAVLKDWRAKKKTALLASKPLPLPTRTLARADKWNSFQTARASTPSPRDAGVGRGPGERGHSVGGTKEASSPWPSPPLRGREGNRGKAGKITLASRGMEGSHRATETAALSSDGGYLLDFELAISASSFRWQADKTYYVSGPVTVTTNIFEGGCVLKYAPTNSAAVLATSS